MPYSVELFMGIITEIKNAQIKEFVIEFFDGIVPEYFWEIPASSSGKHHPDFALGEGGLPRHTLAACLIARDLFVINSFSDYEKDVIIAALLLHDTFKQGIDSTGNTVHEHPLLAAEAVRNCNITLDTKSREDIASCISSHMGQWTKSKYSKVRLPRPRTKLAKFVHMCDYLASRKLLEVKFE